MTFLGKKNKDKKKKTVYENWDELENEVKEKAIGPRDVGGVSDEKPHEVEDINKAVALGEIEDDKLYSLSVTVNYMVSGSELKRFAALGIMSQGRGD